MSKGDKHCRIIGKPLLAWEDADELKKLFSTDPLVEKINNLQFEVQQLSTLESYSTDPENIVADSKEVH